MYDQCTYGWLYELTTTVFAMRHKRFFYLEGTSAYIFDNESFTAPPISFIPLERCIADGVWQKGELHTFTLRSLSNEQTFLILGCLTAKESENWVEYLQKAIILADLYELYRYELKSRYKEESSELRADDVDEFDGYSNIELRKAHIRSLMYIKKKYTRHDKYEQLFYVDTFTKYYTVYLQELVADSNLDTSEERWKTIRVESGLRIRKCIYYEQKRVKRIAYRGDMIFDEEFKELTRAILDTQKTIFNKDYGTEYIKYFPSHCVRLLIFSLSKRSVYGSAFTAILADFNEYFLKNDKYRGRWQLQTKKRDLILKIDSQQGIYRSQEEVFYDDAHIYIWSLYRQLLITERDKITYIRVSDKKYCNLIEKGPKLKNFIDFRFCALYLEREQHVKKPMCVLKLFTVIEYYAYQLPMTVLEKHIVESFINFTVLEDKSSSKTVQNNIQLTQPLPEKIFERKIDAIPYNASYYQLIQQTLAIELAPQTKILYNNNYYSVMLSYSDKKNDWEKYVAFKNSKKPPPDPDPSFDEEEHDREYLNDEREQGIFEKFREKYAQQGYKFDNNTYLRILWSKEYDLEQACYRLDDLIKWRKEMNVDALCMSQFPEILYRGIYLYLGKDRYGRPVAFVRAAKLLPGEMDLERLNLFFISFLEYLIKQMKGSVDTYIIILDVQNLSMNNISMEFLKKYLKMLTQYYCSRSYKMRVLNSGFLANWAYKIVSGLLSKRTQSKVKFVGCDLDQIRTMLKEDLDDDIIPTTFGGTNEIDLPE